MLGSHILFNACSIVGRSLITNYPLNLAALTKTYVGFTGSDVLNRLH